MTQEERKLLLKDLCARLPYGIKFHVESGSYNTDDTLTEICLPLNCVNTHFPTQSIKPYLRPMSSMTEEEKKEYNSIVYNAISPFYREADFYNSHHLDYRGLIEKGLALEAPEGMYEAK